jgi:radical SAM superfamily enzyme YgiQ (UPF0313 family)
VEAVTQLICDYENDRLQPLYSSPQSEVAAYDLDYSLLEHSNFKLPLHLVEATRGCNWQCKFCVLPAEGARHTVYGIDNLRRSIDNSIANSPPFSLRRLYPVIWFVDNNFGNNRKYLLEMCNLLQHHKRIKAWGALVTQDLLHDHDLVRYLRQCKCRTLFTGLESLDTKFLREQTKTQNMNNHSTVVDDIHFAERQGICIMYGYLFDPRQATVNDMQAQIEILQSTKGLPMSTFFSFVAPLPGTRLFWESLHKKELIPGLRLRDLDGEAVVFRNLADNIGAVAEFSRTTNCRLNRLLHRPKLIASTLHRILNARTLNPFFWYVYFSSNFRAIHLARDYRNGDKRSFVAGSDLLDPQYFEYPPDISEQDFQNYFTPIELIDQEGEPAAWLLEEPRWSSSVYPSGSGELAN